jgi:hypothetical protein
MPEAPQSSTIMSCNVCKEEPFKVPWDVYGIAMMKEHLKDEHGLGA